MWRRPERGDREPPSSPSEPVVRGVTITTRELITLRRYASGIAFAGRSRTASPLAGGHASPFRGRGIDFEEVRAYQPGDDIRSMDWRVTARTGKPHTKLYREERERPALFLVDLPTSMAFGTRRVFKSVQAATITALMAWNVVGHGDRVGGLVSGINGHSEHRPQGGKRGILQLLKAVTEAVPTPDSTAQSDTTPPLSESLARLRRVARPGSLVCLVSDFQNVDATARRHLISLARHTDMAVMPIFDPLEAEPPPPGAWRFSNGLTSTLFDGHDSARRRAWQQRFQNRIDALNRLCQQHRILFLPVSTADDPVRVLRDGLIPQSRHGHNTLQEIHG
ncbi:MAG: DUF58 domain-containing protein [Magnetococcales bacterium]|nr:DUF58 domain-containing protein [Magnetococcales bacterium]